MNGAFTLRVMYACIYTEYGTANTELQFYHGIERKRSVQRSPAPLFQICARLAMKDDRTQNGAGHSRYRWLVFFLLAFGYLLVNFHRLCPAVVALDMMEDLGAGGALMGILASAYFYPYALMQLPSGLLSDSWGPRKTITGFFILAGISSIFFGMAQTASWAIFARVLVGLGVAMFFVPTMKILTRWFKESEFSFMTGILMATGGVGLLTAASPLAFLSDVLGWRGSFMAIGVVTLALAAAIWLFVRDTPTELNLPEVNPQSPKNPADPSARKTSLWTGVWLVLGSFRFWPLALWFAFNFAVFFSFGGLWGGPYLMQVYGLSKQQAGGILSMLAVSTIIGSPLFSLLSDRVVHSRKKVIVVASVIALLLTIPLAFFPASLNVPLLYIWALLFGLSASAVVVVAFAASKESFPVEMAGTSRGACESLPISRRGYHAARSRCRAGVACKRPRWIYSRGIRARFSTVRRLLVHRPVRGMFHEGYIGWTKRWTRRVDCQFQLYSASPIVLQSNVIIERYMR